MADRVREAAFTRKIVAASLQSCTPPPSCEFPQVANASVRHNALLLFVDVFPLQNPDAPNDQTDDLLQASINRAEKLGRALKHVLEGSTPSRKLPV